MTPIQDNNVTKLGKKADEGNANAAFKLGLLYSKGDGVDEDQEKSVFWYNKASEIGHRPATYNLARRYMKGRGTIKNNKKALKLFESLCTDKDGGIFVDKFAARSSFFAGVLYMSNGYLKYAETKFYLAGSNGIELARILDATLEENEYKLKIATQDLFYKFYYSLYKTEKLLPVTWSNAVDTLIAGKEYRIFYWLDDKLDKLYKSHKWPCANTIRAIIKILQNDDNLEFIKELLIPIYEEDIVSSFILFNINDNLKGYKDKNYLFEEYFNKFKHKHKNDEYYYNYFFEDYVLSIEQASIDRIEKEKISNELKEKEKEMLSFFTHTMRNALATAPESLRQAIRLLGSEDYESNQKHYEAINEITALFSTLTLTDCLIDTFKQSIYDTEEFKRAWQQDNAGDATPEWFIAAALRQSLNRIIFMEDATGLRKLINNQNELIKPTRKAFIEQVLPLDVNQYDVEKFYHWLQSITALEVTIDKSTVQFGANQIKFSLMFAISSELILNALKYWSGTGKIQIDWHIEPEHYIFSVKNACKANASSQLAGTHKGLAFINRLIELLGEQAQFNCSANELTFNAELKLHKTLLKG